jgi:RHH-type proline utilization regulon transcriptional repressor/proline dehydrogenase/delta 1-pyrroline-5-carboxylate dehydrogenase
VRVYAPFGELIPGMAYLVRRLMENTANVSFLRQGFVEHKDAETLLAPPEARTAAMANSSGRPIVPPPGVAPSGLSPGANPFVNCSDTDFLKEASRMALHEAIERVRGQLGREYKLVIGGEALPGAKVAARENPARPAQTVARIHWADAAQAARDAQCEWERRGAADRAQRLARLADRIEARRHDLAAWEVFETGKPWREADADVSEAIDYCRYYGRQAVELMDRPRRSDVPGENNLHRYLPRGVGVVISPWNFPLAILAGMTTAALAAGNAVILKPSGQSSAVAGEFMAMVQEAGFPAGVVNYLPGSGQEIGAHLV